MKVTVKFFATVRQVTQVAQVELELGNSHGVTVGDVMELLAAEFGAKFKDEVLKPTGGISENIRILLNGHFIDRKGQPLSYAISDGDTLFLFPLSAGG